MNLDTNKRFENYYLFLEDTLTAKHFSTKIITLNHPEMLWFSVAVPIAPEDENTGRFFIPYPPDKHDLFEDILYSKNGKPNEGFFLSQVDYFITDASKKWELYSSVMNGLQIFGCDDDLNASFKEIFKPYETLNLEKTYDLIVQINGNDKELYISEMERQFKFSKNI